MTKKPKKASQRLNNTKEVLRGFKFLDIFLTRVEMDVKLAQAYSELDRKKRKLKKFPK